MDRHFPDHTAYQHSLLFQLSQPKYTVIVAPFAAIGALYVSLKLFSFVRLIFSLFILPGKSLRSFGPKGSWAIVTGASDGIGLEYATQLARAGFNILLVSRTQTKLTALANALESNQNVKTQTLAIDFATATDSDYTRLARAISGLDVAVLINNVGKSHDIPVPFAQTELEELKDIITINCMATLRVTSLVLPVMQKRRNGLILTMGSFGGLLPTPLLATYSGSKAFLQHWSTSLGAEVKNDGITVELVQSYLVTSAMSKIRRASATIPTPKAFVRSVLSNIGRSGGAQGFAYSSTPFWSHGVMQWALTTFVGLYNSTTVGFNMGFHESIRKRALRKKERDAKKQ